MSTAYTLYTHRKYFKIVNKPFAYHIKKINLDIQRISGNEHISIMHSMGRKKGQQKQHQHQQYSPNEQPNEDADDDDKTFIAWLYTMFGV